MARKTRWAAKTSTKFSIFSIFSKVVRFLGLSQIPCINRFFNASKMTILDLGGRSIQVQISGFNLKISLVII